MTYSQLLERLTSYDMRTDQAYLDEQPSFVNLAENRLATELKQQGFQAVVNGTFDLTNTQKKPTFWRETISFGYLVGTEFKQLYLRTLEYCREYWPSAAETTEEPKYYADYNINNFYLAGTPAAAYQFQLVYYARLDPLTKTHQENWLTLNAPQALLYAALLESAMWRKSNGDIQKWTGQYQGAVASLMRENVERLADRGMVVERG